MSYGIPTSKLKRNIQSLSREKQRESIERFLRVLPQWIMDETATSSPNEKVIKYLENNLKMVRGLWTDYLIKYHVRTD
jgi:hypothetical protein